MNNDLISRSALIKHLRGACIGKYPSSFIYGLLAAADETKAAPAVDAVEVVRCENCIYNDSETNIPGFVYCNFYDCTKDFDGYCDEGERRDDES